MRLSPHATGATLHVCFPVESVAPKLQASELAN